jgi:hypothetical protein
MERYEVLMPGALAPVPVTSTSYLHLLPSRSLWLRKPFLLLFLLHLELIRNYLCRYFLGVRSLQPLRNLQAALVLRQADDITPTCRIQHPLPDLRPTGTRRDKHDGRIWVAMPVEGKAGLLPVNGGCEAICCGRGRRDKLQSFGRDVHTELHEVVAAACTELPQRTGDLVVGTNGYAPALRKALALRAAALERFGFPDVLQSLLFRRKRVRALGMLDMPLPSVGCQFVGLGAEYALRKVLAAKLPHKREACCGEQHLLAYRRCVGDVCDSDEGFVWGGENIVAAEEDVERLVGLDEVLQVREVFEEGHMSRWDGRGGHDYFLRYGGEDAALGCGRDEVLERFLELRRGWGGQPRRCMGRGGALPEMPDCMIATWLRKRSMACGHNCQIARA